jgi:S1-C subfamily serine protease
VNWRATGVGVVVALVGLSGCANARRDPTSSAVTIQAIGCRSFANRASGMVVGTGLVATVAHAVAGESDISVSTRDGRTHRAAIAAIDTDLDAAVLRVDDLDAPALALGSYVDGEAVILVRPAVVPTPIAIRRRVTVRTTDIYREGDHLRPGFELGAAVHAGDSGGGVVGSDGRLLAVVWATSRELDDQAWALSVDAIGPMIAAARAGRPAADAACSR